LPFFVLWQTASAEVTNRLFITGISFPQHQHFSAQHNFLRLHAHDINSGRHKTPGLVPAIPDERVLARGILPLRQRDDPLSQQIVDCHADVTGARYLKRDASEGVLPSGARTSNN
jgi:hypothetical protein